MRAQWIWCDTAAEEDRYVQFYTRFSYHAAAGLKLNISSDTKYAVYVNDSLAAFGQYPDYPWYKIYDGVDLSAFADEGNNTLKIVVYYCGNGDFATNYDGGPGLWFELKNNRGELLACSGEECLSAPSPYYISGKKEKITSQLGYRIAYDAKAEEPKNLMPSRIVEKQGPHFPRPVQLLVTACPKIGELVKECGFSYTVGGREGKKQNDAVLCNKNSSSNGQYFLFDLKEETVGLLWLSLDCKTQAKIVIGYGEHITDGRVRAAVGNNRDFTFTYFAKKGNQNYICPFMRFAARYIQVFAETKEDLKISVSLVPVEYPVQPLPFKAGGELRQKIYDVSVRTLRLCMHDHYEDCPWREQALYALDSRNQMLYGYSAFGKDSFAYARANLKLIGESSKSGLLPITFPTQSFLRIPSFSLYYIIAMREYAEYTADYTLLSEYYERMQGIVALFAERMENGFVPIFYGSDAYWNFYEWAEGLEGKLFAAEKKRFDLPLNALFSLTLQNMQIICGFLNKKEDGALYAELSAAVNRAVNERFYDAERGLYRTFDSGAHYSETANAFAVLCHAAQGETAKNICRILAEEKNGMVESTLSMTGFVYDALLLSDKDGYRSYILSDIEKKYGYMLQRGATSFWETIKGEADFGGSGSLCHGWSAMPAYYYHILQSGQKAQKNG